MRLRLTVPEEGFSSLMEKLNTWNAKTVSKDQSGSQLFVVSRILLLFIMQKFSTCKYRVLFIIEVDCSLSPKLTLFIYVDM